MFSKTFNWKKSQHVGDDELILNAKNGNLAIVRNLLQKGANVNAKDNGGDTALTWACYKKHIDIALEILKRDNVDVNAKDSEGRTALYLACNKSLSDVALEILKRDNVDVNAKDSEGRTALYWACNKSLSDVALDILKRDNVDVNAKDSEGRAALYLACNQTLSDVALEILKRDNVDVNAKDSEGRTALYWACSQRLSDVALDILKPDNVDVNAKDSEGRTALYWACHQSLSDVALKILKRDNVDVNAKNASTGLTALYWACNQSLSDVALEILNRDNVDVNAKDSEGETSIYWACSQSLTDVALEILKRDNVDVNAKASRTGQTALDLARANGLSEIVRYLEEYPNRQKHRDTEGLKDVAKRERVSEEMRGPGRPAEGGAGQREADDPPRQNESCPPNDDAKIEQDRSKLRYVMNTTSADPAELSLDYIKLCITARELGKGAFGHVFFAEDSHLPKKFAVKRINLERCDDDTINNIRKSFQLELSTLKRFRHPNIIALYGYNLNVSGTTDQFLVYEYAAKGSLDGFLRDDGNRARLRPDTRLSIMFEMARAVHFLHTGGCSGWKVFHRDIKSANICLAEDFTARLIDCGLAKFVPDENSNIIPGSVTPSVRSTSGLPAFGSPGYMCPEYASNKAAGIPCPYIAAFDVFSIGVVLVELILGCLIGGQSTRNGMKFDNAFLRYVRDNRYQLIKEGCEKLKRDADPVIIWNPDALELVCKTAIRCMAPFPEDRLSTADLLGELNRANQLQAGIRNAEPEVAAGRGCPCVVCNRNRASMQCSEGHALCSSCIEEYLLSAELHNTGGHQLRCLIHMCSSQPLQDKDLYRHINVGIFIKYTMVRELYGSASPLSNMNELLQNTSHVVDQMHAGQQDIEEGVDEVIAGQKKLATGLNWALGGSSLLTANQFRKCPNLVVIIPCSVEKVNWSNPKKWVKTFGEQQFTVQFFCGHSHQPGHDPFEISVTKEWIVAAAPWLKKCLQVLAFAAKSQRRPFPIPDLSFLDQFQRTQQFYDSLIEGGTPEQMKTLEGEAFNAIAEKANKKKRSHLWKGPMVCVSDENGAPIWVKEEYKKFYQVDLSSSAGIGEM